MAHSKSAISEYWTLIAGNGSKHWDDSGDNMGLGYDIFRELSDGNPLWIAQAATLKESRGQARHTGTHLTRKVFHPRCQRDDRRPARSEHV